MEYGDNGMVSKDYRSIQRPMVKWADDITRVAGRTLGGVNVGLWWVAQELGGLYLAVNEVRLYMKIKKVVIVMMVPKRGLPLGKSLNSVKSSELSLPYVDFNFHYF